MTGPVEYAAGRQLVWPCWGSRRAFRGRAEGAVSAPRQVMCLVSSGIVRPVTLREGPAWYRHQGEAGQDAVGLRS